ncbi:hypothetical protein KAU11_09550, partial [Candidatus Babeliales bacterium]|nr:hypothetical protein [Candidatus Babeliales bacterium]
ALVTKRAKGLHGPYNRERAGIHWGFICHRGRQHIMNEQVEEIKTDILAVIDRLDALKAGKSIEIGFLIERGEDILNEFIRYDLDEIEQAIKKAD